MSLLSNKKDNEIAKLKSERARLNSEIAKKDNEIEELQKELKELVDIEGSIISFDFDTEALKKYYHEDKHITNAYKEIESYLEKHGFVYFKDNDYKSNKTVWYAKKIIKEFSKDEKNKWFALCIKKCIITPRNKIIDM